MKNWQDTVLTGEEMSQEIQRKAKKWSIVNPKFIEDIANITANKQAEITWPIAFKAGETVGYNAGFIKGREWGKLVGIKEVTDFIGKYISFDEWGLDTHIFGESDFAEKWQAFLKEKGIVD